VSASALRPRTITELIDAAFQLLRRFYLQLVSIAAVFLIPVIILQASGLGTFQANPIPTPGVGFGQPGGLGTQPFGYLFGLGAAFVLGILGTSGVVVGVSDSYVNDRVEVGPAVRRVLSRFLPILGGTLVMIVMIFVVMVALAIGFTLVGSIGVSLLGGLGAGAVAAVGAVIVGILAFLGAGGVLLAAYARIFAVPMVIVLEGTTVSEAFARSMALTRGSVWRVVRVFLLVFVIIAAVFALVLFSTTLLLSHSPRFMTIYSVVGSTINIFAYPLYTVFITLLYYDLRIRRDGYDLEVMAKELTGAAPAAPA